jgi:NAD(P)-dependent dehydrogenase (short-subunit alcohol dehydrogenase family)
MTRSLLVTGAAGGLGADIAQAASADGYRVALVDVNPAVVETAARIPNATGFVASTTDEGAIDALLDSFGTPDGVVNNAGIVRFGPLLDQTADQWRSVVEVNLTGTFTVARAVARRLVAEKRAGAIVNITSMNGVMPGPNAGAYAATKSGISMLTKQMAVEWGQYGLRVNAIAPGLIDGGMSGPIYADPQIRALRESRVPLGRLGRTDDVSRAVLWLLSDASEYITGEEILVDGGVTISVIAGLPRPQAVDAVGVKPVGGSK